MKISDLEHQEVLRLSGGEEAIRQINGGITVIAIGAALAFGEDFAASIAFADTYALDIPIGL